MLIKVDVNIPKIIPEIIKWKALGIAPHWQNLQYIVKRKDLYSPKMQLSTDTVSTSTHISIHLITWHWLHINISTPLAMQIYTSCYANIDVIHLVLSGYHRHHLVTLTYHNLLATAVHLNHSRDYINISCIFWYINLPASHTKSTHRVIHTGLYKHLPST